MGMKSTGGEIVQVQGGHIVRSTGRKDRHSKVYTAKGPRDRRVRLSAHTAIQFYDVQDRLGYDRPSKAVDWLIKKAKSAIDKLAELPPWHPIPSTEAQHHDADHNGGGEIPIAAEESESSGYNFQVQGNHHQQHSAFIPSPIDTDAIPFFPTTTSASAVNFQNYPPDIISRGSNSSQDLGLSLHSFQDHGHSSNNQTLFAAASNNQVTGFDPGYHPRIVLWNNDASANDINRTPFMVNSSGFLGSGVGGGGGSSSGFSQRGTLQSSFSQSIRPWNEIPMASSSDQHKHHQPVQHQASIFGSRFLSDALQGFCIPARIRGEDESHGNRASSSASPNSHH